MICPIETVVNGIGCWEKQQKSIREAVIHIGKSNITTIMTWTKYTTSVFFSSLRAAFLFFQLLCHDLSECRHLQCRSGEAVAAHYKSTGENLVFHQAKKVPLLQQHNRKCYRILVPYHVTHFRALFHFSFSHTLLEKGRKIFTRPCCYAVVAAAEISR